MVKEVDYSEFIEKEKAIAWVAPAAMVCGDFDPLSYLSFLTLRFFVFFSLSLATIAHVIESWEALKRTKNYEEFAGKILFQT